MRSGYRLAVELDQNGDLGRKGRGESSNPGMDQHLWKAIWRIPVPNKIRVFIWRCCRSFLALRHNLKRRKANIDDVCAVCGTQTESERHVFLDCHYARLFWFGSPLQLNTAEIQGDTFSTMLGQFG